MPAAAPAPATAVSAAAPVTAAATVTATAATTVAAVASGATAGVPVVAARISQRAECGPSAQQNEGRQHAADYPPAAVHGHRLLASANTA